MGKFHCPKCGRFVSDVYAEEYGELLGKDSWYPYYAWRVVGLCKNDGRIRIEDHDGEDACSCYCVDEYDCWWDESLDERLETALTKPTQNNNSKENKKED